MNIYKTEFFAVCPVNKVRVKYALSIRTGQVIRVEEILAVVGGLSEGLHEDLADRLLVAFGGTQVLTAHHHGVDIEAIRPHLAHWDKPSQAPSGLPHVGPGPVASDISPEDQAREAREWAQFAEGRMG